MESGTQRNWPEPGALSSSSETVPIPRQGRRPVLYPGSANDRGAKTWPGLRKWSRSVRGAGGRQGKGSQGGPLDSLTRRPRGSPGRAARSLLRTPKAAPRPQRWPGRLGPRSSRGTEVARQSTADSFSHLRASQKEQPSGASRGSPHPSLWSLGPRTRGCAAKLGLVAFSAK